MQRCMNLYCTAPCEPSLLYLERRRLMHAGFGIIWDQIYRGHLLQAWLQEVVRLRRLTAWSRWCVCVGTRSCSLRHGAAAAGLALLAASVCLCGRRLADHPACSTARGWPALGSVRSATGCPDGAALRLGCFEHLGGCAEGSPRGARGPNCERSQRADR